MISLSLSIIMLQMFLLTCERLLYRVSHIHIFTDFLRLCYCIVLFLDRSHQFSHFETQQAVKSSTYYMSVTVIVLQKLSRETNISYKLTTVESCWETYDELGYFGRLRPFHQRVQVVLMKVRCFSRTHRWLEKTSPKPHPHL